MAIITLEALKQTRGHKRKTVHVEEWDADIGLRTLSAGERFEFEKVFIKDAKNDNALGLAEDYQTKLVFLCAVDDNGKRLFATDEDMVLLREQPAYIVSKLYQEAQEINALDRKKAEKLEKNSEKTGSEGSVSDSPSS